MNETNPSSSEVDGEREKFVAELEQALTRPRVGVLPPVAALAMVAGLGLAYSMLDDARYFFSSSTPIELGAEGDYHLERAVTNRYAQVHGVPTARGWYVEENEGSSVVIGVIDTSLLVKRTTFEDENRRHADGKRPQPRQNPFFARGRLLSRADAAKYEDVFREYEAWNGAAPQWLLLAEQPPGKDFWGVTLFAFVLVFVAVNGWLLARGIQLKRKPSASFSKGVID